MKVAICDIEGDGLYDEVTRVHCGWLYDVNSDTYWGYPPNRIHLLASDLNAYDVVVFHNGVGYDLPTLEKLYEEVTSVCYDTLVGSRLLNPDRINGHSLKVLGKANGVFKDEYGEVEDNSIDVWKEFNWEMYWYCRQDVVATVAEYNRQLKRGLDPSKLLVDYMGEFLDEHRPSTMVRT